MTYQQIIASSTTWTCPLEGKWQVVCVGGGGSGVLADIDGMALSPLQMSGGTTSFGTYVSAEGGTIVPVSGLATRAQKGDSYRPISAGGVGGYTGIAYLGNGDQIVGISNYPAIAASGNGGLSGRTGYGYGASGGARGFPKEISLSYTPASSTTAKTCALRLFGTAGNPGNIRTVIVDLSKGDTVACTIGAGGSAVSEVTSAKIIEYVKNIQGLSDAEFKDVADSTLTSIKTCISNGNDGAIFFRYIGESM